MALSDFSDNTDEIAVPELSFVPQPASIEFETKEQQELAQNIIIEINQVWSDWNVYTCRINIIALLHRSKLDSSQHDKVLTKIIDHVENLINDFDIHVQSIKRASDNTFLINSHERAYLRILNQCNILISIYNDIIAYEDKSKERNIQERFIPEP